MPVTFKVGDKVQLLGVPHWLIHDLPEKEVFVIKLSINKITRITEIDKFGYIWLNFSAYRFTNADGSYLSNGHNFCITKEYIKLAN